MAQAFPAWPLGIPLAMHVYITTSPRGDVFSAKQRDSLPHFVWDNITFGDWSDSRTVDYDVKLPEVCWCMHLFGRVVSHRLVV